MTADRRRKKAASKVRSQDWKVIRDPAFGQRLNVACDNNPQVPAMHKGRQSWIRKQLAKRFSVDITPETVRKWFSGESRPRPDKMRSLAELLQVDEAWLSLGAKPDLKPQDRKVRNAAVHGAVNLVAGAIAMSGGHPAFPKDDDKHVIDGTDLYAIIRGGQYNIHVALAQEVGKGNFKFVVPANLEGLTIIGVVQRGTQQWDFIRFDEHLADVIEKHGGYAEVKVHTWNSDYFTVGHRWKRADF